MREGTGLSDVRGLEKQALVRIIYTCMSYLLTLG